MKSILFNTEMVRAILDGRKTCTRRVVKPQPTNTDYCKHDMVTFDRMLPDYYRGDYSCVCRKCGYGVMPNGESAYQPPYKPGVILYVRETWSPVLVRPKRYIYRADADLGTGEGAGLPIKWHPSIHMPKEASRIFLRVTDVRVERLLTPFFSDGAAMVELRKEGMALPVACIECICNYEVPACVDDTEDTECGILDEIRGNFSDLWDKTIKPSELEKYGWRANPWVWVIEFERCEKPEEADHG